MVAPNDHASELMTGGRQSDYGLIKQGAGGLALQDGDYRFSNGSVIEGGNLYLTRTATLHSNVSVQTPATLGLYGTLNGSVTNHGGTWIWGVVNGDVVNHGITHVAASMEPGASPQNIVRGNFRQFAGGTLVSTISRPGYFFGLLQITGRADLDGTLELQEYGGEWDYFDLSSPGSTHILHADGGVFGQFARWTSPGLFIEGGLRYGSQDVWFDIRRISVEAAMAANSVADPMTLASAANVDAALTHADGFALSSAASLGVAQRQFLASASSILNARDVTRAARSLDSLSGHAHALAQDVLHQQTDATIAQLDARLDRLPRGSLQGGAWSAPLAHHGRLGGGYSVDGNTSGFDQWLSPNWLIGASVAGAQSQMQFDRMGGSASGTTSLAGLYAQYRSDRAHATLLVGTARARLDTSRPIDLGGAGEYQVFARRALSQTFVHGEAGRRVSIGAAHWTPYVALDYAGMRSDAFNEQGETGFELAGQPGNSGQLSMAVGGRYRHEWNVGGQRLGLTLDARYQRVLATHGDELQAAFAGMPDAQFGVQAWPLGWNASTLGMGLTGNLQSGWIWAMDYRAEFGNAARDSGLGVALRRPF